MGAVNATFLKSLSSKAVACAAGALRRQMPTRTCFIHQSVLAVSRRFISYNTNEVSCFGKEAKLNV